MREKKKRQDGEMWWKKSSGIREDRGEERKVISNSEKKHTREVDKFLLLSAAVRKENNLKLIKRTRREG